MSNQALRTTINTNNERRKKKQIFSLSPSLRIPRHHSMQCRTEREDTYSNVERHTDLSSQRPRMGSSLICETGRALIHYLLLSFHLKSNQPHTDTDIGHTNANRIRSIAHHHVACAHVVRACVQWFVVIKNNSFSEYGKKLIYLQHSELVWCRRTREKHSKLKTFPKNVDRQTSSHSYCLHNLHEQWPLTTPSFHFISILFLFNNQLTSDNHPIRLINWQKVNDKWIRNRQEIKREIISILSVSYALKLS